MNPFERGIRTVDAWQQRHRGPAFVFAVFKKFGDDQGGNLVALLTYFAFVATFPLLLALTGILVATCFTSETFPFRLGQTLIVWSLAGPVNSTSP